MNGFLYVALGGALGASLRHGAGLAAVRLGLSGWPWATFFVNLLGSLLMGLLIGDLRSRINGLTRVRDSQRSVRSHRSNNTAVLGTI